MDALVLLLAGIALLAGGAEMVVRGASRLASPGGLRVERKSLLVDIPLMAGVMFLCVPELAGLRMSVVRPTRATPK